MTTFPYSSPTAPGGCPIKGCAATRKHGHLMCALHWSMVPHVLQVAVYTAWRRFQRAEPGSRQEHLDAKTAAIEHVENELARLAAASRGGAP